VPDRLLEAASFELMPDEAIYLRERIHASAPGSLLDLLVGRARPARHVPFPWRHPDVGRLPKEPAKALDLARVFSEVMHGASLLYNLMLAEARRENRAVDYRNRLEEWAGQVDIPEGWTWDGFWAVALLSNPRIPALTRRFIERWFEVTSINGGIADDPRARSLISDRERVTKGSQARLHNRRALELWGGSSGTAQLAFRWPVVERIVNDILKGISSARIADARA
jgi:hypothetical protein